MSALELVFIIFRLPSVLRVQQRRHRSCDWSIVCHAVHDDWWILCEFGVGLHI